MAYTSIVFLSFFLPVSFLVSLLLRKTRLQGVWLLLAGLVFYAWAGAEYLPVLAACILLNWLFARMKHHRTAIILAVIFDIGMLVFFKCTGFLIDTVNSIFGLSLSIPKLPLPLGVSFFTFQALSYVLDAHTGGPVGSLSDVALYVSFFPKLVSGPIVQFSGFSVQRLEGNSLQDDVYEGCRRFIIGLSKKLLLADTLAKVSTASFQCPALERGALLVLMGTAAFTLQLYFDFSGYTDMAIGLGRMFGYRLPENFYAPLCAYSLRDFWRRWHVTLSGWFRRYVYIPLGGSRRGNARTIVNLFIVFGFTGLWHGANWTFLVWGLWNALFVSLEHAGMLKPDKWPRIIARIYVLIVVMTGFAVFNSGSIAEAGVFLSGLASPGNVSRVLEQLSPDRILVLTTAIAITAAQGAAYRRKTVRKLGVQTKRLLDLALLVLLIVCYMAAVSSGFHPFIYASF